MYSVIGEGGPILNPIDSGSITYTTTLPVVQYKYAIDEVENGFILYYNGSTYVFSSLNKIFNFLKKEESDAK